MESELFYALGAVEASLFSKLAYRKESIWTSVVKALPTRLLVHFDA
jgi:hypothetical protein